MERGRGDFAMRIIYRLIPFTLIALMVFACVAVPPATTQPTTQIAPTALPGSEATAALPPRDVLKPGEYNPEINYGGIARRYILHVPASYDGSRPLPLVLVLHGRGGNALGMVKSTGMDLKANQEKFFVAYLNGTGDPQGWNNGLILAADITADDVGFVRAVIAQLGARLNVDASRVYAAGFSNGAMMSYRLGAELSDHLAAIAVVEGTIGMRGPDGSMLKTPNPAGPIPVIIIHGKQDANLPYDGGQGLQQYVLSVADAVTFWTQADGCTETPQEASNTANVLVTDYPTCAAGSEVILYTVVNGEHEWPTLQGHTKFSATDAIWEFFSRHSLP
jgi:polyhydroxybutyrate depolymerase